MVGSHLMWFEHRWRTPKEPTVSNKDSRSDEEYPKVKGKRKPTTTICQSLRRAI
jgi:hypothetical protein